MPKHKQRPHLGIDLGAGVYPLLCTSSMVDKLEEATYPTNAATPTPPLLANPTLPGVLFSFKVLLPLPIILDGTNATPDN